MSKTRLISTLTTGLAVLAAACWLVTGAFPLTAEPQMVSDAAGVTVNLNGSTVLHRAPVHYPTVALERGVQGTVSVEVKLDASGNVSDARVLGGPDELRSAVLQSVLEWHFTRDAAGGTRVVEVAFESPSKDAQGPIVAYDGVPVRQGAGDGAPAVAGVVGGIVRGVPNGMQVIVPDGVDGVGGGIVSGVPGTVTPDEQQSPMRIASIVVSGLSDQARSELLASLPVHDGDELNTDLLERTKQAVKAFDEHLAVQRAIYRNADGTMALSFLLISLPGARTAPMLSPGGSSAPAAFADTPGQRIKVGGNVQAMMIVSKAAPVYPELAKSARVSGVVRLAVLIAKNGTIQEIHSLDGPALLIQAAMDAVKQWVYKPTFLNGEPVAVESTIDVNFTLNQ